MFFSGEQTTKTIKKDFLSRTSKATLILRRTFLFFLTKKEGSATVEALLIIPPVFTFYMSVVWLMSLYFFHAEIGEIVNDAGYNIVMYSYPEYCIENGMTGGNDDSLKELVGSVIVSEGYIRNQVRNSEAAGHIAYLTCLLSKIDLNKEVNITVKYLVKPYVTIPGFNGYVLTNVFYSKTYAGYSEPGSKDEKVYITKYSTVYHTSADCRALKHDVKKVLFADISSKRNNDGSRYFPCKRCYDKNSNLVYVAPYGIKYHSDANCRDLKVDIYEVWKSEVKERRKCSFCH